MTCIVGLIDRGKVYMGGDSLASDEGGHACEARKDLKVFQNGDFLMGFTSSYRMGQVLRYAFTPPPIQGDLFRYMVVDFCNALRQEFKEAGYAKIDNGEEAGGTFLVGANGRLFTIYDDYQVSEGRAPYASVGCGSHLALGALHALAKTRLPAKKKVLSALSAAETFSAGVRRPFKVLCQ